MASKVVDYIESPYESNGQRGVGHSSDLADTLRSLKEGIRSCKVDNGKIMQAQEKQVEVNAILLQSLQGPLQINHGHEDKTNGAYGNRSHIRHRSDRSDTIRDGRVLDTLDRRGDRHRYYSSSDFDRHHDHHHYQPYMRNDRGYFLDEFKKKTSPTFDGEMKK